METTSEYTSQLFLVQDDTDRQLQILRQASTSPTADQICDEYQTRRLTYSNSLQAALSSQARKGLGSKLSSNNDAKFKNITERVTPIPLIAINMQNSSDTSELVMGGLLQMGGSQQLNKRQAELNDTPNTQAIECNIFLIRMIKGKQDLKLMTRLHK